MGRIIRFLFFILLTISIIIFGCQKKSVEPQGVNGWKVSGMAKRFSFGTPVRAVKVTLGNDSCLTDGIGAFHFDNIASGEYQIAVITGDYKIYKDSLVVTKNSAYYIGLQDSANMVGQVRNLAGANVPGAVVAIGDGVDTTDIDGIFAFHSAPLGLDSISCSYPGYYPFEDTVTVTSNYKRRDLTLQSEYNLVGYVSHFIEGPIAGAVVSVGDIMDTTNENGYYRLGPVPAGKQALKCQKTNYNEYEDTIIFSPYRQEWYIYLKKLITDTFFVTEDSWVGYTHTEYQENPFGGESYLTNINHGQDEFLRVSSAVWSEYIYDSCGADIIYHFSDEIAVIKLPELEINIGADDIVSALLVLTPKAYSESHSYPIPGSLIFYNMLSGWDEDSITWANKPAVSRPYIDIPFSHNGLPEVVIDASERYITKTKYKYGIMIEPPLYSPEAFIKFYSSENADTVRRPKIILTHLY